MLNKRGATLLETIIALFVVALIVVGFLQSLGVGINGTFYVGRETTALNLAKTQIEYVKAQPYNQTIGDGNLRDVYGLVTNGGDISDNESYVITGDVRWANTNQTLQKITVNVSYVPGDQAKVVTLYGYKNADQGGFTTYTALGNRTYMWAWADDNVKDINSSSHSSLSYSASTADYIKLGSSDNAWWNASTKKWSAQLYVFQISSTTLDIQNISVKWEGYACSDVTIELRVYNYNSSAWTILSSSAGAFTDQTRSFSLSNPMDYVSSDTNNVSILVAADFNQNTNCKNFGTDYIEMNVTSKSFPIVRATQDLCSSSIEEAIAPRTLSRIALFLKDTFPLLVEKGG